MNEPITSPQAEYDAQRSVTPETPCPYLPDRLSRSEAYHADQLEADLYEHMQSMGFRRSGRVIYRPACRGCHACRQLRVLVPDFAPTRSMLRIQRKNVDVTVVEVAPVADAKKFDLYQRYLDSQHDQTMSRTFDTFRDFLYDSPTDTSEFDYFLGHRLIGVSIVDRCPNGLSSVYMFFDPEVRGRSLGTYSALWEIEHCRQASLPYYYLGYYIADCKTMSYKSRFRPNELLERAGHWVAFRR